MIFKKAFFLEIIPHAFSHGASGSGSRFHHIIIEHFLRSLHVAGNECDLRIPEIGAAFVVYGHPAVDIGQSVRVVHQQDVIAGPGYALSDIAELTGMGLALGTVHQPAQGRTGYKAFGDPLGLLYLGMDDYISVVLLHDGPGSRGVAAHAGSRYQGPFGAVFKDHSFAYQLVEDGGGIHQIISVILLQYIEGIRIRQGFEEHALRLYSGRHVRKGHCVNALLDGHAADVLYQSIALIVDGDLGLSIAEGCQGQNE